MSNLEQLQPSDLHRAMLSYEEALTSHKKLINSLNVYPVPDGDTGTNMHLTVKSALKELEELEGKKDAKSPNLESADMHLVCQSIRKGSIMGARGNSGVILSQVFKCLTEEFEKHQSVDASVLASALREASKGAYESVQEPVEGTILTVVREVSEAATEQTEQTEQTDSNLGELVKHCLKEGEKSLAATPEKLEVLAKAGVVDAGGKGFLLFLNALDFLVSGEPLPIPSEMPTSPKADEIRTGESAWQVSQEEPVPISGPRYEVMYFLEAEEDKIADFRQNWSKIGESIVVVGADGLWKCHIHTDETDKAVEVGEKTGRPYDIQITDLYEEVGHSDDHLEGMPRILNSPAQDSKSGIIFVGEGEGIAGLFESLGAHSMVEGGQSRNPSVELLLQAIEMVNCPEAVILPNNSNIAAAAEKAAEMADKNAAVVFTRSIPEGIAAMLSHNPEAGSGDNAQAMQKALEAVASGSVTKAVRSSEDGSTSIKEGQYIGLDGSGVVSAADSLPEAACSLLKELIKDDHECATLYVGAEVGAESDTGSTEEIKSYMESNFPEIQLEICEGGQPLYHYFIGVE